MVRFFTRERFGRPQVLAGCLLLVFLAQCLWLVGKGARPGTVDIAEIYRLERGASRWQGKGYGPGVNVPVLDSKNPADSALAPENGGYDAHHSPLWYLIAAAPLRLLHVALQLDNIRTLHWLAAAPFLMFGLLLGASLWYVARRLFGNAGGYVALMLYCFSPGILRASSLISAEPEVGAAWGAFGAIFTAIAVAHTLYAPREVILWNWRRILLLALSLVLAVGSQFSLIVVVPVALGIHALPGSYSPEAAFVIWMVACASRSCSGMRRYFFHARAFWQGMVHASLLGISWPAYTMPGAYHQVLAQMGQSSPALVVALPVALITYFSLATRPILWQYRTAAGRRFVSGSGIGTPHYPGLGFQFMTVPFCLFSWRALPPISRDSSSPDNALAAILGLLVASAAWNLWELARVGEESSSPSIT